MPGAGRLPVVGQRDVDGLLGAAPGRPARRPARPPGRRSPSLTWPAALPDGLAGGGPVRPWAGRRWPGWPAPAGCGRRRGRAGRPSARPDRRRRRSASSGGGRSRPARAAPSSGSGWVAAGDAGAAAESGVDIRTFRAWAMLVRRRWYRSAPASIRRGRSAAVPHRVASRESRRPGADRPVTRRRRPARIMRRRSAAAARARAREIGAGRPPAGQPASKHAGRRSPATGAGYRPTSAPGTVAMSTPSRVAR